MDESNGNEKRMNNYSVEVIIPAYRSGEKLNKLLTMLYCQTVKPDRVVILHTEEFPGQEQPLPEISESNITVVPIEKDSFDHGGTRKYGASLSKADIMLFMTQDAVPADNFLIERLLEPFDDPKVAASYARQLPDEKTDLLENYIRHFNYPKTSRIKSLEDIDELGIKAFFCSNVCAAYRKSEYDKLGGFVDKTIFNEDMILAAGIIHDGCYIAYQADARVIHAHNYTYLQQFSRNFDLGVSHNQFPEVFYGIKSESEGIKLVKNAFRYLLKKKKYFYIPDLIISSGFKFLGYQLGLRYDILPLKMAVACSMNKAYWK